VKQIVIVGGVAAGMSAAARLRRLDEQAHIVVLERDRYVSYANCGLPYHIGGAIPERESLLVATPEHLRATLNLDVRTEHEVVAVDRAAKRVRVRDHASGASYSEPYDVLVLAQGAGPLRPSMTAAGR
jgi:NADPH-dependent 2,4-dienoyl-CoA reductase/sulfur reductase-like enzyme